MLARINHGIHSLLIIIDTYIGVNLDMHGHNKLFMRYLDDFWFHLSIFGQFGLLDGAFRKLLA